MRKSRLQIIFIFILFGILLLPSLVMAQSSVLDGLEVIREPLGMGDKDLRESIASLINVLISVLGIFAVVLIMYAGLKWMFSMGEDDKIADAKQTLIGTIIGLIIIFSSYSLADFVITSILSAT